MMWIAREALQLLYTFCASGWGLSFGDTGRLFVSERAFGDIHRFLRVAALFDSKALSKSKAQNRAQLGLRNFGNRNRTEPRLRRRALADGCAGRLVHRWRRTAYRDSDFTKARTPRCNARLIPSVKVCVKIPDPQVRAGSRTHRSGRVLYWSDGKVLGEKHDLTKQFRFAEILAILFWNTKNIEKSHNMRE